MSSKHTSPLGRRIDNASFLNLSGSHSHELDHDYRLVPEGLSNCKISDPGRKPWRVIIAPVDSKGLAQALEILGDVVVGSNNQSDSDLDVNVSDWRGYDLGVSRRHVMLRPSRSKLFIMDLRSTNGTHINGLPLGVGWAYALNDGDLITLGRLHIRLRVTQRPD